MADIVGTPGDDPLSGTTGDDTVTGLGGNDTIDDGGPGIADIDTLDGGDGDDLITLGDARDTIIGGNGFDTLAIGFPLGPGGIFIDFSALWATGTMAFGTGSISGIERLTASISGTLDNDVINLGATYDYATEMHGLSGNDTLIGGAAADTLFGEDGADYLIGADGDDQLDGGLGQTNTLQGGLGNDTYIINIAGDSIIEFADEGYDEVRTTLTAYVLGSNVDYLRFSGSGAVVGIGNALDNRIVGGAGADQLFGMDGGDILYGYDPDTGAGFGAANTLIGGAGNDYYYVDGVGDSTIEAVDGGSDIVITYASAYALQANIEGLNFFGSGNFTGVGNDLGNSIRGGSFADVLIGLAGDDSLDDGGFFQADTMIGGTGNDSYRVSNSGASIIELAGEGYDTVYLDTIYVMTFIMPANVEEVFASGGVGYAVTVIGNDLNNQIYGGSAGGALYGMGGNDQLTSFPTGGVFTLFGGTGNDYYEVSNIATSVIEYAGEGTDQILTNLAFFTLPDHVENLAFGFAGPMGNPHDAVGIGNALDNFMQGNQRNNQLNGNDGNDILRGEEGNDSLYGGNGSDILVGGSGLDRFYFLGGESGIDTISDFVVGADLIYISRNAFGVAGTIDFVSAPGASATSANATLLIDTSTNTISFDSDGNGAGAAVALFTSGVAASMSAADFIFY